MFDDLVEAVSGGWGVAMAAVVGTSLLAGRGGRPLAKKLIQGYLTAEDTVRGWAATVVEEAQDLYAESKAELASEEAPASTSPARASSDA